MSSYICLSKRCGNTLLPLVICILCCDAIADGPTWWVSRNVINPNIPGDDYAVLNIGQLKHMAAKARDELNASLTGGSGAAIDGLVNGWANTSSADDYAVCNLGQLKAVAKLYWDRLIAEGHASSYPWTVATGDDDSYASANLGQLKSLFDIEQGYPRDSDGDGMPDFWEIQFGLNPASPDGTLDLDGDGIPNREDARPNNPAIGRLSVTITSPGNGSVLP